MGPLRRSLRGLLNRGPATVDVPVGAAPDPSTAAAALVGAGIFDQEFYEAQSGLNFPGVLEAAVHFVQHNDGVASPHPLINTAFLPRHQVKSLREGRIRPLLKFLRTRGSATALSVFFDPRNVVTGEGEASQSHRAGVIGHWLAQATPDSRLPGNPALTWGEARALLLQRARSSRRAPDMTGPRTTLQWDHEADRGWRRTWSQRPAPPAQDAPLVTVIMPARNRASILPRAVRSLQAQTLPSWELVVIDDGSTDESAEVVRAIASEDARVHLIGQDWQGVGAARNTGLEHARGRFVAFLDTDNQWHPDFLHLMVTAMDAENLLAAVCAVAKHRDDGSTHYLAFQGGREHLLIKNHVDLNALVVDTAIARSTGGFDPSIRRWVDHDFALKVSALTDITLLPFLGVDYHDDFGDAERITTSESDAWEYVVLNNAWCDWPTADAAASQRVPGRVSVVIPNYADAAMVVAAVSAVLRNSGEADVEVVVVDNGSSVAVDLALYAAWYDEPRVTLHSLPRNLNFAGGSNVGLARSTGEYIVFLNNDTQPRPGWLPPLIEALSDPQVLAAQPLLTFEDDSIQSAGTAFPVSGATGVHFLIGHPPEDAARLTNRTFHALTAACLAMRATDALSLRGLDPMYRNGMEDVDLCLRASMREPAGRFVVVPESRVTHAESKSPGRVRFLNENRRLFLDRWADRLPQSETWRWAEEGFALTDITDDGAEIPAPRFTVTRDRKRPTTGLRWGVHLAAIPGEAGDAWGDVHFGAALVEAFASREHQAGTYRHRAHDNPSRALDDVSLVIRGLDRVDPVPGVTSVLWVISHPELVTPDELQTFDLVYAASKPWAEEASRLSGRTVQFLPQATNLSRRASTRTPVGDGRNPLFVGNTHEGRPRQIVLDAIAGSVPVSIHGPGWHRVVPAGRITSAYVDNRELSALYRAHGLVLNDHWPEMAQLGFMNNRLYDAVAAGARVITDPVAGLDHFGGAVQVYHSVSELALLCSEQGRSRFPDAATMVEISERIATEDSFEARADRLIADVLAFRETLRD